MQSSSGDAVDHPVTELEAVRSILVQGLPLLDQELTESSIVQVSLTLHTTLLQRQVFAGVFVHSAASQVPCTP